MKHALAWVVLLGGCNTEIDLTVTFDPATVASGDVDRLTLLHIAVDGIERANHDAAVEHPKRSQRIVYLPRATAGRLDFVVAASDPSRPDDGNFAAGVPQSVEIRGGQATALELVMYGPGGPGPVDGGTFEGDLTGFGATDAADDSSIDSDGGALDGPPPDLVLVKLCASPAVYLCDNFDTPAFSGQWEIAGDVVLDGTIARSTPNSVRTRANNNLNSMFGLVLPSQAVRQQLQTLWLRAYIRQGASNPQVDTVIFNAVDGAQNGYAIVVNTSGKLQLMKTGTPGNLVLVSGSSVSFSTSTFECFTWEISAGVHTELRKNDTAIGGLTSNGLSIGPIESWGFGNGPQGTPTTGTYVVYFDDVLVDDQPLTCAQ